MLQQIVYTAVGALALALPAASRPLQLPLQLIRDNTTATFIEALQYDTGHNFTIFVDLVDRADLSDFILKLQDVTVFAPNNDAFENIPGWDLISQQLDNFDATDLLKPVLEYHILKTVFRTPQLAGGENITLPTQYNNQTLFIEQDATTNITLVGTAPSQASIIQKDVLCAQGIIQVIDAILIPADSPLNGRLRSVRGLGGLPALGGLPFVNSIPEAADVKGLATPQNLPKLPTSTGLDKLDQIIAQLNSTGANLTDASPSDLLKNQGSLVSSLQSIREALMQQLGGKSIDTTQASQGAQAAQDLAGSYGQDAQKLAGSYGQDVGSGSDSITDKVANGATKLKDSVASILPNLSS